MIKKVLIVLAILPLLFFTGFQFEFLPYWAFIVITVLCCVGYLAGEYAAKYWVEVNAIDQGR